MRKRHEGSEMRCRNVARNQRHNSDQPKRYQRGNGEYHLHTGNGENALALNKKADQHEEHAKKEGCVYLNREAAGQAEQHHIPGIHHRCRREQRGEHIARGERGANGDHRSPTQPIGPCGNSGKNLAVFQPGHRTRNCRAAGLMREHRANFGIGEHLDAADHHGGNPHQPGR